MSLEIARRVNAQYPHLLQTNTGATCYQFTQYLIENLRAAGHLAYSVCKSPGEGQYIPPGFQLRDVTGLDGKTYKCSGVSHDAIWCDGNQFDTIGGAHDGHEPYGAPATPQWNAVPPEYWRPWNPPLKMAPVVLPPDPRPRTKILPKGEAFAKLQALNAFYQAPEGLQRPGGLVRPDNEGRSVADMEAIAQWFYQLVIEGVSLEDVFTQIRNSHEWQSKHP